MPVQREGRDAAGLADLLLMGRLREAWIAPWEIHKLTCEITLVNTAIALSYGLVWTAGILLRIRRLEVRIPPSAPLPPSHDNAIGRDEGLAPRRRECDRRREVCERREAVCLEGQADVTHTLHHPEQRDVGQCQLGVAATHVGADTGAHLITTAIANANATTTPATWTIRRASTIRLPGFRSLGRISRPAAPRMRQALRDYVVLRYRLCPAGTIGRTPGRRDQAKSSIKGRSFRGQATEWSTDLALTS
jgi:hypothetical protein